MKTKFRNVPKHIKLKALRNAVLFCVNELISKRLQKSLTVDFEFNEEETDKDYGRMDYIDEKPIRDFIIYLNPTKKREDIISTIFHEVCHVEQLATGRWFLFSREHKSRWKERIYRTDPVKIDNDKPWEVEAYNIENKLITRLEKFLKDNPTLKYRELRKALTG